MRNGASAAILLVFLICFAGWPNAAEAIPRVTLYACADIRLENYGAFGTGYRPVSCRGEFSASDPYLVLYAQLDSIDSDTEFATELLDPEGSTALSDTGILTPKSGQPTIYTFSYILPLAADIAEIRKKFPTSYIIRLGRPASERLGEWTWKFWVRAGPSAAVKFTLKPSGSAN